MNPLTNNELPIGIFDSGVGGLTVLHALKQILPKEHFLYLGDTARLPYGTKSPQTVKNYALNANEILMSRGIKALVVACNTATAIALEVLKEKFHPLPVIGVVVPGAKASLSVPSNGPIVVLATESTAKGQAYSAILATLAPGKKVIEWPCQLLVALAEEGWNQGELVESILEKVLAPLFETLGTEKPACFLLGCTHFPVFKTALQKVVGGIPIIDPAEGVAQTVFHTLCSQNLLRTSQVVGVTRFLATDSTERFARVAKIFLGYAILPTEVELVTVPITQFENIAMNLIHSDIVLEVKS